MTALIPAILIPYILGGLGVSAGLLANWWLEITDWNTAIVFAGALASCLVILRTDKPWARIAVMVIFGVALYLKGGIDKTEQLKAAHQADMTRLREHFVNAAAAEEEWQRKANAEAEESARQAKEQADADLAFMRTQLGRLAEQASKDPRAHQPSLSIDAVRRLNMLRRMPGSGS
jgi:hypothetical protein